VFSVSSRYPSASEDFRHPLFQLATFSGCGSPPRRPRPARSAGTPLERLLTRSGVAREHDAGAGVVPEVPKTHHLDVRGGAEVVRILAKLR